VFHDGSASTIGATVNAERCRTKPAMIALGERAPIDEIPEYPLHVVGAPNRISMAS